MHLQATSRMIKMLTKVFLIGVIYTVIFIGTLLLLSLLDSIILMICAGLIITYLTIISLEILINNDKIWKWIMKGVEDNDV